MIQLSLGLALFTFPHLWKRVAPTSRLRLGDPGKGIVAVLSVAGIWLMARGYGAWFDDPVLWQPAGFLRHINNLLVVVAFYLFAASGLRTRAARLVRHPQLVAVILWATAHLLVNGNLAAIILFGGLLIWAAVEIILVNRAGALEALHAPGPALVPDTPFAKEVIAVVATIVTVAVAVVIHGWVGPWPLG